MKVLLTGGGTGGHIFPLLAVAEELRDLCPSVSLSIIGAYGRGEERIAEGAGLEFYPLKAPRVAGGRIGGMLRLPPAVINARGLVEKISPDVVLGMGGYVAGPVVFAASLSGRPCAVIEPNAVAGWANKILGLIVKRIFVAFERVAWEFPPSKVRATGNPVRRSVINACRAEKDKSRVVVLVFGGSQGARTLNRAVTGALEKLSSFKEKLHFIHQTGKGEKEAVKAAYAEAGFSADVHEFIDDMGSAYAAAHLVIARSGSSVCEIAAAGLPSILVPYPRAARDHQAYNAMEMERLGAAVVIPDAEAVPERMAEVMLELLTDKTKLSRMAKSALKAAKPNAAKEVAKELLVLAGEGSC